MPKVLRIIDVKPQNERVIDILPKNEGIKGEFNRGFDVVLSAGMYLGLPFLIMPTIGTVIQWSETG